MQKLLTGFISRKKIYVVFALHLLVSSLFLITGIDAANAQAPTVPSGYLSYEDSTDSNPLTYIPSCSDRKLVILIHGWTDSNYPPENSNSFYDSNANGDWFYLNNALALNLNGSGVTLLNYHWENDASTGSVISNWTSLGFGAACTAATNGYSNGDRLANELNEFAPDLREVTFIAHSAGAWVAYEATKALLNSNNYVVVNLVLLDPFMPENNPYGVTLNKAVMGSLSNSRIYKMENYYSVDLIPEVYPVASGTDLPIGIYGGGHTSETFTWRANDVNQEVDYNNIIPVYSYHAGPIQFYADTVTGATSGESVPSNLYNDTQFSSVTDVGFYIGLIHAGDGYLLPRITRQPPSATQQSVPCTTAIVLANAGDPVTMSVSANNAVNYQWFYNQGLTVTSVPSTGPTLIFNPVVANEAATYVVGIQNAAGWVYSEKTILIVSAGATPTLTPTISITPNGSTPTSTKTSTPTSSTITYTPTLTYTQNSSGCPSSQTQSLITNGDFETGTMAGWTSSSSLIASPSNYPYSGSYYVVLGDAPSASDWMYQTVSIPANATSATLSYFINISSSKSTTTANDLFSVEIYSNSTWYNLDLQSNVNQDSAPGKAYYHQRTIDLSTYKGQTIIIKFQATTDSSSNLTIFRVDDISLTVIVPSNTCTPTWTSQGLNSPTPTFTFTLPSTPTWTPTATISLCYAYLNQWGTSGSSVGQFSSPYGLCSDASGNVYVADPGNNRIAKFTKDGLPVTQWGSAGDAVGQFNSPYGVAVDPSGNIYVADTGNYRIQEFSNSYAPITQWGSSGTGNNQFGGPYSVALDTSGNIYVADGVYNRIQKFSSSYVPVTMWTVGGLSGLAIDSSGYIYAAGGNRIVKYTTSGTYVTQWGGAGSSIGQFNYPFGPAIDSSGYIYVADQGNNRVQVFTNNGDFITQFGVGAPATGNGNGQFTYPSGVATDHFGNIFVTDSGNDRIQKFSILPNCLTLTYTSTPTITQTQTPTVSPTPNQTPATPSISCSSSISTAITVANTDVQMPRIKKFGNNVYIASTDGFTNFVFYKSTDGGTSFAGVTLGSPVLNSTPNDVELGMDTNGYLYAFWESQNDDQIYLRVSLDGGTSWSAASTFVSGFSQMNSPSSYYSNGTLYVVFAEGKSGVNGLYLTTSTNNGSTFTTPVLVTSGLQANNPCVAVHGSNVYVAYMDLFSSSPDNTYLATSTNGGASFNTPVRVNRTAGKSNAGCSLGVDGLGNVFVAYTDTTSDGNGDVDVAKSTDGGSSFASTLATDSTTNSQNYPVLFIDSNNYVNVLWRDERGGVNLSDYYTRSTDGGASYAPNINMGSPGNIYNGWLYVDSSGTVFVTETNYNPSPWTTLLYKLTWLCSTPTPTVTHASTITTTPTISPTQSPTSTQTVTPTQTGALSNTPTATGTQTVTPTATISTTVGICSGVDPDVGQIIFCDDFSGPSIDLSKWITQGMSESQSNGILTISEDVTDTYSQITTTSLDVSNFAIHLRHWMQDSTTYPGYFFPSIALMDASNNTIASLVFLKSSNGPDYCSDSTKYNRVLLKTYSQGEVQCTVVGTANSDSYYNRWTETLLTYDSSTGNVAVDLDADGVIDLNYTLPNDIRQPVHKVTISGYGWFTGQAQKLDYVVIGTGGTAVPTGTPTMTYTPTITPTPTNSETITPTPPYPETSGSYTYPQPASDHLYFVYDDSKSEQVKIAIYNFSGERIASVTDNAQADGNNRAFLSLQQFAPGVYFYIIRGLNSETLVSKGKFLVEKR